MKDLTKLQRRILAELEEAWEDHFSALTNTVAKPHGDSSEITAMQTALRALLHAGYVEIARYRRLNWVESPVALLLADAEALIAELPSLVEWDGFNERWEWRKDKLMADIWLTESGSQVAHQILSEDGWPTDPLRDYDH